MGIGLELYLHIGTPKTGTTSIQGFLRSNREVLRTNGILCPLTFGKGRMARQVLPDLIGVRRSTEGGLQDRPKRRGRLTDDAGVQLGRELQGGNYHKTIFSERIPSGSGWGKFRKSSPCEHSWRNSSRKIFIIAYIRRQDDYVSSAWSTASKGGATEQFSPPVPDGCPGSKDPLLESLVAVVRSFWAGKYDRPKIRAVFPEERGRCRCIS